MDRHSIKRTILGGLGVLALSSVNALAQEIRSNIRLQSTGLSQKTPAEMGFGNTRPTPVDFWLAIATTSILGWQQRRTTDMTATSTRSLAQLS
jgi:hypothetical protein